MPPPPPPPLMDELVEEVLLRLPPDSPASLVHAGLVCKRWCHLVTDPGFRRRFIDFHRRAPPMLFVVWNPITGEQLRLPEPPQWKWKPHDWNWNAAVLCAAAAAAATAGACQCDHLDCSRGPFIVVLVSTVTCTENLVCIYSSETSAWSEPTYASRSAVDDCIDSSVRSTLVGTTLYFVLTWMSSSESFGAEYKCRNILGYNLATSRVSVVKLPRSASGCMPSRCKPYFEPIQLTTTEDGRLGFVRLEHFYYPTLCLWSRTAEEVEDDGSARCWALSKTIPLLHLLPYLDKYRMECPRYLLGSAEGVGTIILKIKDDVFTADLRSRRVTKVYTLHEDSLLTAVVPYVNFCTPRTKSVQP